MGRGNIVIIQVRGSVDEKSSLPQKNYDSFEYMPEKHLTFALCPGTGWALLAAGRYSVFRLKERKRKKKDDMPD